MVKKRMSRALAIFLAVVMCFTMTSTIGFADNGSAGSVNTDSSFAGKDVNLLVFGNSTSSGFGMPDFVSYNEGYSINNNHLDTWTVEAAKAAKEARISDSAYPWQMKQYFLNQEGANSCDLTPICLNGMRTDELRAFLDEDYYQQELDREAANAQRFIEEHPAANAAQVEGFLTYHMRKYVEDFNKGGGTTSNDYNTARDYIQNEIKNADVIVVDLCGNNFGTYMGYRLNASIGNMDRYGPNTYDTLSDVQGLPEGLRSKILQFRDRLVAGNDMMKEGIGQQLVDAYLYGIADCIVNFNAEMEWINQNKKEGAKVIAVGLDNPLKGLALDAGGQTIDLGQVAGGIYNLINSYIKAFDKNADHYYYADLSGGITTFYAAMATSPGIEEFAETADGAYTLDLMCDSFVSELMGGAELDSNTKNAIKGMLFEASKHPTVDLAGLIEVMTDPNGMEGVSNSIQQYLYNSMTGQPAELSSGVWGLLNMEERILLSSAVGSHPNTEGCNQKYEQVLKACQSNDTARTETKKQLRAWIRDLGQLLRSRTPEENINEIAGYILKINAVLETMDPEQMQGLIEEYNKYRDQAMELVNNMLGELLKQAQGIQETDDFVQVALLMQKLQNAVQTLPLDEASRAELQQQLEFIQAIINKQATDYSKALMEQIQQIAQQLQNTNSQGVVKQLVQRLLSIGKRLIDIGVAVYNLPEFEKAMNSYMETSKVAIADLDGRVFELENQMATLTAKSIDVAAAVNVTFPNQKARFTISWVIDDDATGGYIMKVNGQEVNVTENNGVMTYTEPNAQIGKAYSYEITPYVYNNGSYIAGKTFKGTVVPQVNLPQVKIKSLKKARKAFTVKWAAIPDADGYQVSYKTGKKTKIKNVAGNKTSVKIKKLKSKRTYTVKVRACTTVNGQKYYGPWSKAKKVKTK